MLIERDEIGVWRRKYLRTIHRMRQELRKIYYLDETWLNAGHTRNKVWVDGTVSSSKQAFLAGLSTGNKAPSGKGKRLIITHIGSQTGFVENCLWVFESKKSGDYHEEMNAQSFEKWFSEVLPRLEDNSVIVLDNAPYHSRKQEIIPNSNWTKPKIVEWLVSKNIPFEDGLLKKELLVIVNEYKPSFNAYAIDEMAKAAKKTVLRLPPYHCELNPIELVWAQIKNGVASKNTTFKMTDVKNLLTEAIREVSEENWRNCVRHVEETVEKRMWQLDDMMEETEEPLIINVNQDSSSCSSDTDH